VRAVVAATTDTDITDNDDDDDTDNKYNTVINNINRSSISSISACWQRHDCVHSARLHVRPARRRRRRRHVDVGKQCWHADHQQHGFVAGGRCRAGQTVRACSVSALVCVCTRSVHVCVVIAVLTRSVRRFVLATKADDIDE
jgi:hypothetical protein